MNNKKKQEEIIRIVEDLSRVIKGLENDLFSKGIRVNFENVYYSLGYIHGLCQEEIDEK